jgi:pimeloyl-ACP methyl ester carboxylesterase
VWDRLGELGDHGDGDRFGPLPVLVVAGADDAKFVAAAVRLAAGIGPSATLAVVPGAGHTVHLEAPDPFAALLLPWLERASRPDAGS